MALQADIARAHLEAMVEEYLGIDKARPSSAGEYFLIVDGMFFVARIRGVEPPTIRLSAVVGHGIEHNHEALAAMNEINRDVTFLRAMLHESMLILEGDLLALSAEPVEFSLLCNLLFDALRNYGPKVTEQLGCEKGYLEKYESEGDADVELPGYL